MASSEFKVKKGLIVQGGATIEGSTTINGRDLDVDNAKLDGIEAGATTDQVAGEVTSTASGNLTSTNVQDALVELQTDIDNINTSGVNPFDQSLNSADNVTFNNLTVTGTVDGRDVATDGLKLDGVEVGAEVNVVTSVAGDTGDVVLDKNDVGLNNVDNTSDLSKPISTATQSALDGKVDDAQVLTNVPAGAVFTDTVYTHPVNHPPSIISQDVNNRFVTDAEKATWNGKADAATTLAGYGITNADTSAEVDAKIAALVDSAPGTLDTLNELAAALGDDPNFATTMTNALAGKQAILGEGAFVDGDKTKLDGIEAGAQVNTVDTVAGRTGAVVLTKSDVGLANVDNTSDVNKPISTATQTALDGKQDTLVNQVSIRSINGDSLLASGDLTIAAGVGGFSAALYFSDEVNTINGAYKTLSYVPDVVETIETIQCSSGTGEVAGNVFLFDLPIDTDKIDAGKWTANLYAGVDSSNGDTVIRYEGFMRAAGGAETTLFTSTSPVLTDIAQYVEFEVTEPVKTVDPTSVYGVRLFASTTSNGLRTVSITVGDGNASYTNTPLAIRHDQLRARDQDDQHPINAITGLQTALDGKADLSGATFTGDVGIGTNFAVFDVGSQKIGLGAFTNTAAQTDRVAIRRQAGDSNTLGLYRDSAAAGWALDVSNSATGSFSINKVGEGTTGTKLTVLDNGKVGIGSVIPTSELSVSGDIDLGNVDGRGIALYENSSGVEYAKISNVVEGGGTVGVGIFTTNTDSAGTEKMRISGNGKIGLGTTTPTTDDADAKVVVGGRLSQVANDANLNFKLKNTGTGGRTWQMLTGSNGTSVVGNGEWALRDETAGTQRIIVDTSGNSKFLQKVSVGGTHTPESTLHLKTGGNTAIRLDNTASGNGNFFVSSTNAGSTNYFEIGETTGGNYFTIVGDISGDTTSKGSVGVGTTTFSGAGSKKFEIKANNATETTNLLVNTVDNGYFGIYQAGDLNSYLYRTQNQSLIVGRADANTANLNYDMVINGDGDTLIATNTELPNATVDHKLQVNGIVLHDYVWKDMIAPFQFPGTGGAAPSEVTDGSGARVLSFAANDEVTVFYHVNHDYAEGTDAFPHIHWSPTTTMTVGETVVWEFRYTIARGHQQGQSLTGTPTVVTITHTADGTEVAGEHMVTEAVTGFDLLEPDTLIKAVVRRVSGTYVSAVHGYMADLHYQADREGTSQKSPDFNA